MAAHAPPTPGDAVASRFTRLLGLAGVTLMACACSPSPPAPQASESTTGERVAELREQELTEAHRRALAKVVDTAGPVFADDDPLQRGISAVGAPGVPPVPRPRDASPATPALREARDIDVSRLEPLDAQLLLGLRFGLERADLHVRRPRAPYDPSWALVELGALLDELLHRRIVGSGDAATEGTALREAGLTLFGSLKLLRRASPAGLRGALALVDENRAKLDALTRTQAAAATPGSPEDPARLGVQSLRSELDRSTADLQRRLDGVRDLEELPWRELWDTRSPLDPRRLSDVIDPTVTRRFLSVEERLDLAPRELLGRLRGNLARLKAMDAIAARPDVIPSPAAPLTLARCEAARRDIAEAVSRHPEASAASEVAREGLAAVSCEALVARWGPRPVDDTHLRAELLLHGVVMPGRRAAMQRQPEVLRLLAGHMASRAHRWVLLIGHAHALEAFDVERLAITWARQDACLAAAAVLAHARPTTRRPRPTEARDEIPVHSEQSARAWLTDACPEIDVDALTEEARTQPWRALEGGGLALLDDQPYVMAGLDEFWWLPLGLVVPFAVPDPEARLSAAPRVAPSGPRPAEVSVQVEEL